MTAPRDESFWAGYADLATGTMVIFLLLLAALAAGMMQQQEQQAAEVDELTQQVQVILGTRQRLAEALKEAVSDKTHVDPVTAQLVVVQGREGIQFGEGDSTLTFASKTWLREFIPQYVCALWEQDRKNCIDAAGQVASCDNLDPERPEGVRRVLVTGHADLKGDSAENLRLSSARSREVVRYSIELLAGDNDRGAALPDRCQAHRQAIRSYVERRFVAVGAGDMDHCRQEIRRTHGDAQSLCSDLEADQPDFRRVTFELELTGSDMTGLVLDLLALQGATDAILADGELPLGDSEAQQTPTGELSQLRDEVAKGCFEDPSRYHGCRRYITEYLDGCVDHSASETVLDCDQAATAWVRPTAALHEAVCAAYPQRAPFDCSKRGGQ